MHWINALIDTYDNIQKAKEESSENLTLDVSSLAPLYHKTQVVDVVVDFDSATRSIRSIYVANKKNKRDKVSVIIPVTPQAESRTSQRDNPFAYPLVDQLQYCMSESASLLVDPSDKLKYRDAKHTAYLDELQQWATSEFSTSDIATVYECLRQEAIQHDLATRLIEERETNGTKIDVKNMRVAWKVDGLDVYDVALKTTHLSYIKYFNAYKTSSYICPITGVEGAGRNEASPKVRANNKLFSANDDAGFTYRGRIAAVGGVPVLSCASSSKLHNMLAWLMQQSMKGEGASFRLFPYFSDKTVDYVIWTPTAKGMQEDDGFGQGTEYDMTDLGASLAPYARKLIYGNYSVGSPADTSRAYIIGLAYPVKGRASVVYYASLDKSDILHNGLKWHDSLKYPMYTKNGVVDKSPDMRDMAKLVAMLPKNDMSRRSVKLDASAQVVVSRALDTMRSCLLAGKVLPQQLAVAILRNACTLIRDGSKETTNQFWRELHIACCVAKCYYQQMKMEVPMHLDTTITDRSYLYGRLLALAECAEKYTLRESKKKRTTNAERLWNNFVSAPSTSWNFLVAKLQPYLDAMPEAVRDYYKSAITEVTNTFSTPSEFISNKRLDPMYFIGYTNQVSYEAERVRKLAEAKKNRKTEADAACESAVTVEDLN